MLRSIESKLFKYVGSYSECVSSIEIKQVEYTDEEINTILAKRKGWTSSKIVFSAMAKSIINNDYNNFDRPINEIACIMIALHDIYFTHRNEKISIDRSYKYATEIYKNMFPDEIILYNALIDLNNNTITYKDIAIWLCVIALCNIIIAGIGAGVIIYLTN